MGVKLLRFTAALVPLVAPVAAAPKLRLTTTALGPYSIAVGANGPAQSVDAFNIGDGRLTLSASASVTWLAPTVGAPRSCSVLGTCIAIDIALRTATLARGAYTGIVTISDPNAFDAPQTITVTVQIGGGVPDRIDFFLPPNGSSSEVRFTTNNLLGANVTTQSGAPWLSLALEGSGSFRFAYPYRATARHLPGMGEATYVGSIITSGSTLAAENKNVPVTLRVTPRPIAQAVPQAVEFRAAQNIVKQKQNVLLRNLGQTPLSLSTATASGGNWLSAEVLPAFSVVTVTVDPASLAPGRYQGSVSIDTNAANNPIAIPIQFDVAAQSAPVVPFQGVVNNVTFAAGESVAQGELVALFGNQLSYSDPQLAGSLPLVPDLGGARVLVNDQPAPAYYSSYGQINFQIPYETPPGEARVRVERAGQRSNTITVQVVPSAPRLLRLGIADYGIIVNPDGSFPSTPTPGLNARPARAGEALVAYAFGLGQTTPPVSSGAAAPRDPLARIAPVPKLFLGGGLFDPGTPVEPLFAGLTPDLVGLYQINFVIPPDAPRGDNVVLYLEGGVNKVRIAIQ